MKNIFTVLLVMLVCCIEVTAFCEESKTGSLTGKVMITDGVPMAKGVVFVFNSATGPAPSSDRYWRVPDEIVKTDAEGRFDAKLANGTYFIGAIQRKSGEDIGPPQEGDLFLPFHGDGSPKAYVISNGSVTNVGIITGAVPFKKSSIKISGGITAIEGKVTDASGNPVQHAFVFGFLTPAMVGKPLFISERTGTDGRFLLRVHQGGDYFLKIRNTYGGGAMKAGEIMGSYGQEGPMAIRVKTGEIITGINIAGIRFPGQGPNKKK
jgi:hypothetical protein